MDVRSVSSSGQNEQDCLDLIAEGVGRLLGAGIIKSVEILQRPALTDTDKIKRVAAAVALVVQISGIVAGIAALLVIAAHTKFSFPSNISSLHMTTTQLAAGAGGLSGMVGTVKWIQQQLKKNAERNQELNNAFQVDTQTEPLLTGASSETN